MSLRIFADVPLPGELVLSHYAGLRRAFLDGLPVNDASTLEWWNQAEKRWVGAAIAVKGECVLVFLAQGEEFEALETHRFRWPKKRATRERAS